MRGEAEHDRPNDDHRVTRGMKAADMSGRPRVIVEFHVDGDGLFLVIRNIGDQPAASVRVRFSPAFRGLGGSVVVPALPVFRRLAFLGPGREIEILVDSLNAWLARCDPAEPRIIRMVITFRDGRGRRYRTRIRHDLSIWENLPRRSHERASG
jgi:hypothetical protein